MSDGKPSHIRWFLVFWLFILSAVAYLDRVNISIAGISIAAAYHLTNPQLGRVFSAFLAGYALFQTPGGWLADRLGPRRVLAGGVVWWGIFTALIAIVPSGIGAPLFFFIAARFLLGVGEAVIYPASNQFVSRWIPMQERGIANGLIFAGVGVGLTIHTGSAAKRQLVPWGRVLKSREVWAVTFSYFCYGYVAWIFFSWFYIYLAQVRGLNLKASAFYAMLPFLAMAVCSPLGGIINDRVTRRRGPRAGRCILAAFAIVTAGVFLALGSQVESARLASIVLAGGAGALYLSQSSFWSVTADIASGSSGSVSGFMNTGNQIGGFVTSLLTPIIAERFGWTASFLVAAVLCVLGAAAWLLVDPRRVLTATSNSFQHGTPVTALPAETEY